MNILADIRTNHRRILNLEGHWTPRIELVLIIAEKHYEINEVEKIDPDDPDTMLIATHKAHNIRFECSLLEAQALRQALDKFINSETNTPS